MPSKRTLLSKSPLDTEEARKTLASIKRDLRRVKKDVEALQPAPQDEPEAAIHWDLQE
jgi:hypothetical protein